MNSSKPIRFFTWSDVESCIRSDSSPYPWKFLDANASSLLIYGDKSKVQEDLSKRLGHAYDDQNNSITLASTGTIPRQLPVEILPAEDAPSPLPQTKNRPLWSSGKIEEESAPKLQDDDPKIAAFFSFKGGVGRTTACFATAVRLLSATPAAKVLYVDADLEAPGLTWMTADAPEGNDWSDAMSWVDALCLVQDADDWEKEALPLIAERVQRSTIELDLNVGRREFFLMPAVRSMDQVEQLPITPEHAVRLRGREWVIGNALIALGRKLEVDVILVDLRAGITEFSSPLLLDPRVHTVIVSSCAKQSRSGVCRTLGRISRHTAWPLDSGNLTFLVTQVPLRSMGGDQIFTTARDELLAAWAKLPGASDNDSEENYSVSVGRIDYDPRLAIFDDLQIIAEDLHVTTIWPGLQCLVEKLTLPKSSEIDYSNQIPKGNDMQNIKDKILKLTREHLEFAEQNEKLGILPTPPIQKLADLPKEQLPIAVVLGSKGAGKTFLWSQLVIARDFATFANMVGVPWQASDPALIFPLLCPINNKLSELISEIENKMPNKQEERLSSSNLRKKLEKLNGNSNSEVNDFWLEAIAGRLGLPKETSISLRKIEEELTKNNKHIILVVDGLEEALQTGPDKRMNQQQKGVIRSLIIDLPNQLQAIQARHLSIIVFIRYDLARESIYQNFGQFEAKHRSFALKWSKEDALRLVLWVLKQAGWPGLATEDTKEFTQAPYDKLKAILQPFWHEKMGGKRKEAFTDRWVIAVLSDLKARFQARDIIRFLSKATEQSATFPLTATAMRKAIQFCAQRKVEELEQEITGLKKIFDNLRELPENQKITPIEESKLDLSNDEKTFLDNQGILIKDDKDNKLYMPEIIWKGLGFRSSRPGRIGTLRLQRLAAGR